MLFHSSLGLQIGYLTASCSHEIHIFLPKWISRELFFFDIIVCARHCLCIITIGKFTNKWNWDKQVDKQDNNDKQDFLTT